MNFKIDIISQRILAVAVVIIALFLMYEYHYKKANIIICGFEIIQPVVKNLESLNYQLQSEVNGLKNLLDSANLDNTNLKDSIIDLIALRQKDINQVNGLLKDLKSVHSDKDKDIWVNKAFTYLTKRYEDYYQTGKEMLLVDENGNLKADIATKDAQIRSLQRQVSQLKSNQRLDQNKIANLYMQIDSMSSSYEAIIAELRENAKINQERIATLEAQKNELEQELSKIRLQLASIVPFRIENFEFNSPSCFSRKDNAYILGCMKKVTLSFKLNYNDPSATQSPQELKIVFTLPTKDKNKPKQITKTVTVNANQSGTYSIDNSEYDFASGLYIAQVFSSNQTNTIPIAKGNLYVKRIFQK